MANMSYKEFENWKLVSFVHRDKWTSEYTEWLSKEDAAQRAARSQEEGEGLMFLVDLNDGDEERGRRSSLLSITRF